MKFFGTLWIIPQVGLQPFPMNPPSPPPMTAAEAEAAWWPAVVGSAGRKTQGKVLRFEEVYGILYIFVY